MYLNCPLCGLKINTDDSSCHKECPVGYSCKMICCPNCRYSFVIPESKVVEAFKRLFGGKVNND